MLTGAGLALLALLLIATLYVLSGFYNVAASKKHFDLTTWFLDVVRRQSVWTHSLLLDVPDLDDRNMVQLGAAHFAAGCAVCHGSPASEPSPLAAAMLPEPPGLATAALDWSAGQLFWIVRQGQKYTGMPHWPFPEREDEVWAVTAFLKRLPEMRVEEYVDLTAVGLKRWPADADFGFSGDDEGIENCVRCHGAPGSLPPNNLVPLLSGQVVRYLERALREFRAGQRPSGFMALAASELTDAQISALAQRYAVAARPTVPQPEADAEALSRGAEIFVAGLPEQDVPPCIACHGQSSSGVFPRLGGQQARYLKQQLLNWKAGLRDETGPGAIMSLVANRLTSAQVDDVAVYLQSLGAVARHAAGPGEQAASDDSETNAAAAAPGAER